MGEEREIACNSRVRVSVRVRGELSSLFAWQNDTLLRR